MFDRDDAPKVLNEEQMQTIHDQAMRILTEIGTDVLHEPAREALAAAGQRVEDERVRYDPDWVIEQVAKAPATFPIQARNPERSVVIGEGPPICMNVGGPPFASDLDEGRRSGRMQDHDALVKMTQASDLLTFVQSGAVEPQDLDVVTRHMDCDYSVLRWSDKPYVCYGTSGPKARDAVPTLAEALADSDDGVRLGVVMALESIGRDAAAAVPALARAVRDRDGNVRLWAAKALAKIGPPARAALPALTDAARYDSTRTAAEDAIRAIKGP